MKYFGLALFLIVGIALLCLSYRLRKGDRGVLHEYHYRGIPEDRLLAFQRDIAAALLWMGLCILGFGTGGLLLEIPWLLLGMLAGIAAGGVLLYWAQQRHRG